MTLATYREKRKAVERMQDFIEERLNQPMTLQGLARAAGYSPYYAGRVFKEFTGKNPFDYIRSRRLSEAARVLLDGEMKIVDVAFDFVFDSHEGFTRAFAREFGITPSGFRKTKPPVSLLMPGSLKNDDANRRKGEISMTKSQNREVIFVQIIERPARKLILKRGRKATEYFQYCEEVGCDIWEQLVKVKNALHEPMGLWFPKELRPADSSTYVQGVEVDANFSGKTPEGFDVIDLPPCKMLVFQGQPFDDKDFEQAIHSLKETIESYNPETIGYRWADEDGPRFQLAPVGYRGYIEGRPVRPVA